jgi:alpha-tubulin suppressor-like RCC1 family protein
MVLNLFSLYDYSVIITATLLVGCHKVPLGALEFSTDTVGGDGSHNEDATEINTDEDVDSEDTGSSTNDNEMYQFFDVGFEFVCGLKLNGGIYCWGAHNSDVVKLSPDGAFVRLSTGGYHACALRNDGSIECWGGNYSNQIQSPAGTYTDIATGSQHSCGITSGGVVHCWGDDTFGQSTPAGGTFARIYAKHNCTCGLRANGAVDCWGDNSNGHCISRDGPYKHISIGGYGYDVKHTCGIQEDGAVSCWGDNTYRQSQGSNGSFSDVSTGGYCTYAIRTDGALDGWGLYEVPNNDETIPMTLPEGMFIQIASYDNDTCGLKSDKTIECWIDYDSGPPV